MKNGIRPVVILSALAAGGVAMTAEPSIPVHLSGEAGALKVTVGSVRTSLWNAALAQGAGSFTLENVTISLETASYAIKSIQFEGVTTSRADIDALFAKGSTEPLSKRLAKISAKRIVIPEIQGTITGPMEQKLVYRDVTMQDVVNGVVKSIVVGATATEATVSGQTSKALYGKLQAEDTNLPVIAQFYGEGGGDGKAPLVNAQRSFTGENFEVRDGKGFTVKVARMAGRDFQIRPTTTSVSDFLRRAAEMSGKEKPSDEEGFAFFLSTLDFLDAFQIGNAEASGVEFSGPSEKGPVSAKVARIAFASRTANSPGEYRLEGLDVKAEDGFAKIDLLSFSGYNFDSTIAALRAMKDNPPVKGQSLDPATIRALIPTIGTVRYAGLAFDVPNAENKGGPERVKFSIKSSEFTADKPINGIPTTLRIAVDNVVAPLPPTGDDNLKEILALGYKSVDMSWGFGASWNEPAKEIAISDVSLRGAEMGRVSLKGVLGGVGRDVFDADSAVAMVALIGATAKSVELTVENGGLFERVMAAEAKKQNKTAEALRREYGAMAAVAVPAMLGNSEQARTLGQAVAKFIAKPVRLKIAAKAKSPAGLGVADVMGAAAPAEILSKVDLTAVAEDKI